jgi:hypothetical protein
MDCTVTLPVLFDLPLESLSENHVEHSSAALAREMSDSGETLSKVAVVFSQALASDQNSVHI